MNVATQWYIQQEVSKFQRDCHSAMTRMRHAHNLRELMQGSYLHCPSFLVSLVRADKVKVDHLREQLAQGMVEKQLEDLAKTPLLERKDKVGLLFHREWCFLRGNSPRLCRLVEIESSRLLKGKDEEENR